MKKTTPAPVVEPVPPSSMADEWLTLKEVAKEWKINRVTVRRAIESGQLRAFNGGTGTKYARWRVRRSDLKAYEDLKSNRPAPC